MNFIYIRAMNKQKQKLRNYKGMQNIIYLRKILTKYMQDLHNENDQI